MLSRAVSLALLAAALAPAVAGAASTRDSYVRHHLRSDGIVGHAAPAHAQARATLTIPATWTVPRGTATDRLRAVVGSGSCRYDVTATVRLVAADDQTAQTPEERAQSVLPTPDDNAHRLLDDGTRGATRAWRVVRPARSGQVEVDGLGVTRSQPLADGTPTWVQTTFHALSRRGGVCHAGTWRSILGPQIGDALATSVGTGYAF